MSRPHGNTKGIFGLSRVASLAILVATLLPLSACYASARPGRYYGTPYYSGGYRGAPRYYTRERHHYRAPDPYRHGRHYRQRYHHHHRPHHHHGHHRARGW